MSTFLEALDEAGLRAQYEELKTRAETAERECARLRQEIGEVGACLRKVLSDMRQPLEGVRPRASHRGPVPHSEI